MNLLLVKSAFVLVSIELCKTAVTPGPKYPVVLVPGDGGSQLFVKLNKTESKHWWCEKTTSGYESLWLSITDITPPLIDCFVENLMLVYDNKTRTTHSPDGVDIKTVGFGDTASVEWLDPNQLSHQISAVSYFYNIVEDLVAVGYKRNVSVRGAPFDFRKAPNELGQYYKQLQQLIEATYFLNNQTKCVIVSHSLGNPVFLYFLNHQPQEWKDKYIQSFVSLAGVWAGSTKVIKVYASGDNLGVPLVWPLTVRPEQRSTPSSAFLMPHNKFWGPKEPLIITEHRNYTVNDYEDFFHDINYPNAWQMRLDTRNLTYDLQPPDVSLHCLHGSGLPTLATLVYGPGMFPDKILKEISEDGDGTVNMRSLLACLNWKGKQKYPVHHSVFPSAEHNGILADERARNYIVKVALGQL